MKRLIQVFGIVGVAIGLGSCRGLDESYLDLQTGEKVAVAQDAKTGIMVNRKTGKPLYIYVDITEEDTIYAKTGENINGQVVKTGNKYVYSKDEKYVYSENEKLKISDEGEVKYKDGDYEVKVKENGDMKIKNGDRKIKINGKTGERKIDD